MILFHELNIGTSTSGGGVASGFTALHSEIEEPSFPHYVCVRPCPRCFRTVSTGQVAVAEPVRLQALTSRIKELAVAGTSVMLRGFEPFQHPDLVDIIHALAAAKVRRIGMRTDGAALANLRDAQGCIDNGVRAFEIPFLPREMDALSQTAPLEASFAGIRGIRSASAALNVAVFICADITICTHTARYFTNTVQVAIAAGVDAIRLSCDEPKQVAELLGGKTVLNQAHSFATQNSVAFFGDGCEDYLGGASLYEVIAETAGTAGERR